MGGVVEPAVWNAADWALCGQGRSNLVLRDGRGAVLRIQKHDRHMRDDPSHKALERELWAHLPGFSSAVAPVQRTWLFAAHVLSPLLDFTSGAGTLVQLPAEFVRGIEASLALQPGSLGSDTGPTVWAMLLPDHAHLPPLLACDAPVFVVELKPKCGFLPTAPAVGAGSVKRHTTRFALHQRLKLAQGRIQQARTASWVGV
jgi:inositol-pentakisphosphate 2-kinase